MTMFIHCPSSICRGHSRRATDVANQYQCGHCLTLYYRHHVERDFAAEKADRADRAARVRDHAARVRVVVTNPDPEFADLWRDAGFAVRYDDDDDGRQDWPVS